MEKYVNKKEGRAQRVSAMEEAKTTTQTKTFRGPLAIFTFLLSLPVLALAIWLMYMKNYDCENLLRLPRLQIGIGVGMFFVFLISNAVAYYGSRYLVPGLLVVMVPLVVMLVMGLAFVGAFNMESRAIPASPVWFKLRIHNRNTWNNIKSCIIDANICNDLAYRTLMLDSYKFNMKKLSHMESGCCNPPGLCGMEYVNATYWKKGEDLGGDQYYLHDRDCESWNNDQNRLCYNCNSCRQGFLITLQSRWTGLGIFLVIITILLIIAHLALFLTSLWERRNA